ncbi:MAG: hypothetical protein HN455_09935 [Gammaproteobacteria bacterium]|jgi:hypothetical protein|nr:hypothetical protein [Gammaproteobacteria bacterium]MBT4994053.1 hypothetical protein [Candidatus Neomarinimicrobiota bacterium]MBT6878335.1 hypothetical protein [Gammaproteobacteria bacterium]
MAGEIDNKDKDESRKIAIALVSLVFILGIAILLILPTLSEIVTVNLSPGLGLKDAAVISFFVTIVIMIVFAVSSGDGLLGEIQFILGGFFLFFVIIWLLIAWIF